MGTAVITALNNLIFKVSAAEREQWIRHGKRIWDTKKKHLPRTLLPPTKQKAAEKKKKCQIKNAEKSTLLLKIAFATIFFFFLIECMSIIRDKGWGKAQPALFVSRNLFSAAQEKAKKHIWTSSVPNLLTLLPAEKETPQSHLQHGTFQSSLFLQHPARSSSPPWILSTVCGSQHCAAHSRTEASQYVQQHLSWTSACL